MFERFKRGSDQHETTTSGGATAVADRPATRTNGTTEHTATTPARRPDDREHMRSVRARQREEFGGINWGAAFFGWLVAIGVGALLVGLLAAAGAAVGLTDAVRERRHQQRGGRSASAARSRCSPRSRSPTTAAATSPAACRASTAPVRASARGRSA